MNRISIIVPCRNERDHIRPFLEGIRRQDFAGIAFEVLISDGLSEDGTRNVIIDYSPNAPWLRLIDNPSGTVSAGLNLTLREATGSIVIRMDVHTEYATNYVRECVRALVETGAQNVGGPALTTSQGYIGRAIAAGYGCPFSCGGARFHDGRYEGYVDTVTYGCWWRRTLEELGGFDENLLRNQDDELNLRIVLKGGKIWQTPAIKSWYRPRSTLYALALQYFQYGYWKVAVIRKHRLPASLRHLIPAAFTLFVLFGGLCAVLCSIGVEQASIVTKLYFMVLGVYLLCDAVASFQTAASRGSLLFPALLIVFPVFHISYGAGFLTALLRMILGRDRGRGPLLAERLSR